MAEPRSLRDVDLFKRGLRAYEWLADAVSGATDLDFLVERRGHFLVMESKHWDHGARLPIGQDIVLRRLDGIVAHAPECPHASCTECGEGYRPFTVYLVGEDLAETEHEDGDRFQVMRFGRAVATKHKLYPPMLFEPHTRDDLRQLVRRWEAQT